MTPSMLGLDISKCVVTIAVLIGTNCSAQNRQTNAIDSLIAKGTLRTTVRSFYIKPLVEQYQSLVSLEGSGFEKPQGDLLHKRGFGIRVGYQWGPYELETGLSVIRPAAGYRYIVDGSYGHSTQVRSTDYHQFPLVFRYRIWQPTKRLSLHVGAGVAYNVDLDKFILAPEDHPEEGLLDANGNKIVLARFSRRYDKVKAFFSGEVNVSARYQFLSRFSANLELKRLFSATNIVRLTATQETFNPPSLKNVEARGGANSYNLNLGIAYQLGFRNRYDLNK